MYSMNSLIPFPIPSIPFNSMISSSFSTNSIRGSIDFIAIFSLLNSTPELKIKSKRD